MAKMWSTFRSVSYAIQIATWVLVGGFVGVAGALQLVEPEIVTRTETSIETETVYQCANGQMSNVRCPEPTTTSTTELVDPSRNTALKAFCQAQFDQECVYDSRFGRWVPDPLS